MTSLYEDVDLPDESDLVLRNCIWGFKCEKTWESLSNTLNTQVRFCGKCQKEVHLCDDDSSLAASIALNRCIAIDPSSYIGQFDIADTSIKMGSFIYEDEKD